jgi:hypothetical protein
MMLVAGRYDSDRLDERLKRQYDIELIAPHSRGRRQPHRMAVRCVAIASDGTSSDCSLGCTGSVAW